MDRPCGGTASMIDGVRGCRDCCASKVYTYFGFDCSHDDGGEIIVRVEAKGPHRERRLMKKRTQNSSVRVSGIAQAFSP